MAQPAGRAFAAGAIGFLVMALGARLAQDDYPGWPVQLAGAAFLILSFTMTGHAATLEPRWLGATATALHVLCAAIWTGGLTALLLALRHRPGNATTLVIRFSRLATAAVMLVDALA